MAPPRRVDVIPYVLVVGAVLLGWQVAIQPLVQRAPVGIAIRLAPGSPLVLRRAAESELAAGRVDNAAELSRDALGRSPFDVRALRVVGLTEARRGRVDAADEMLTLAGNWSLRDDPAHAWLVEYRLRRGDYSSSFAHADTLVRRREDIRPQVFNLFTTAANADPQRVLPVLASLLAARPPWRPAYLTSLYATNEGLQAAASLAVLLQESDAPLTTAELQDFYLHAMVKGQIQFMTAVRSRLNRPAAGLVTNGSFDDPSAPEPFQWSLVQMAGASAEVASDDIEATNNALRVEYDGYSVANIARQRLFLEPGRYQLRSRSRIEAGEPGGRIVWTITCTPGEQTVLRTPAVVSDRAAGHTWRGATAQFTVPQGCANQWLDLRGAPLDFRAPMVVWFDQITIAAAPGGA